MFNGPLGLSTPNTESLYMLAMLNGMKNDKDRRNDECRKSA